MCEERAVDRVDDIVERVMAGNACLEGQQAAEEVMVHLAPEPDFHEILMPDNVPQSTSNSISGKGYSTFQD